MSAQKNDTCPECSRSYGPHYKGPCTHAEDCIQETHGLENPCADRSCDACNPSPLCERVFAGLYPTGILYADTEREKGGDYAKLAFLPFSTLELRIERDCPIELRAEIVADAARIQVHRGEKFRVSTAGQTIILGGEVNS